MSRGEALDIDAVGALWALNEDEKSALNLLLERLSDVHHAKKNPMEVVRYMRARPMSLDEAEKMFRGMIEWRLKVGADTILEEWTPPGKTLKQIADEGSQLKEDTANLTHLCALCGRRSGKEVLWLHAV